MLTTFDCVFFPLLYSQLMNRKNETTHSEFDNTYIDTVKLQDTHSLTQSKMYEPVSLDSEHL